MIFIAFLLVAGTIAHVPEKFQRQAALEEIVVTPPEQGAKRERLIVCAQVIDALRRALQESVDAGEVANYRLALAEQNLLRA